MVHCVHLLQFMHQSLLQLVPLIHTIIQLIHTQTIAPIHIPALAAIYMSLIYPPYATIGPAIELLKCVAMQCP